MTKISYDLSWNPSSAYAPQSVAIVLDPARARVYSYQSTGGWPESIWTGEHPTIATVDASCLAASVLRELEKREAQIIEALEQATDGDAEPWDGDILEGVELDRYMAADDYFGNAHSDVGEALEGFSSLEAAADHYIEEAEDGSVFVELDDCIQALREIAEYRLDDYRDEIEDADSDEDTAPIRAKIKALETLLG